MKNNQFELRSVCDNKCAHGCSKEKQLVRVIEHNQPFLLVLCTKAIAELKLQESNQTPFKKVA